MDRPFPLIWGNSHSAHCLRHVEEPLNPKFQDYTIAVRPRQPSQRKRASAVSAILNKLKIFPNSLFQSHHDSERPCQVSWRADKWFHRSSAEKHTPLLILRNLGNTSFSSSQQKHVQSQIQCSRLVVVLMLLQADFEHIFAS